MGAATADVLERLGYEIDLSVQPGTDLSHLRPRLFSLWPRSLLVWARIRLLEITFHWVCGIAKQVGARICRSSPAAN